MCVSSVNWCAKILNASVLFSAQMLDRLRVLEFEESAERCGSGEPGNHYTRMNSGDSDVRSACIGETWRSDPIECVEFAV